MTNPITWLDQKLLTLAASFAKKINWWTGMDNFWLARQCSIAAGLCAIAPIFTWDSDVRFMSFGLTFLALFCFFDVADQEKHIEQECAIGAKNLLHTMKLAAERMLILSFNTMLILTFLANSFLEKNLSWWLLAFACCLICAREYFISIDRPPFKRGQAWQWVKGKLMGLSLRPQPDPQPVPVKQ